MAELTDFFGRFQIRYRRSQRQTKIVVIAAIILCMTALITLALVSNDLKERNRDLQSQAQQLVEENAALEDKINDVGSVQSIQDIAQEELGLVDPNTIVIDPEE